MIDLCGDILVFLFEIILHERRVVLFMFQVSGVNIHNQGKCTLPHLVKIWKSASSKLSPKWGIRVLFLSVHPLPQNLWR
jgi:hypothetical protein